MDHSDVSWIRLCNRSWPNRMLPADISPELLYFQGNQLHKKKRREISQHPHHQVSELVLLFPSQLLLLRPRLPAGLPSPSIP